MGGLASLIHLLAPVAVRTPSTWSGCSRANTIAPAWMPTLNPSICLALCASQKTAGTAPTR
eukprot:594314-Lingulodinium_polyedra.AAC.1